MFCSYSACIEVYPGLFQRTNSGYRKENWTWNWHHLLITEMFSSKCIAVHISMNWFALCFPSSDWSSWNKLSVLSCSSASISILIVWFRDKICGLHGRWSVNLFILRGHANWIICISSLLSLQAAYHVDMRIGLFACQIYPCRGKPHGFIGLQKFWHVASRRWVQGVHFRDVIFRQWLFRFKTPYFLSFQTCSLKGPKQIDLNYIRLL